MMKRLFSLIICILITAVLCACGNGTKDTVGNVSSFSADKGSIKLVNDAYEKTSGLLGSASALSFDGNYKVTYTVDGASKAQRVSEKVNFIKTGEAAQISSVFESQSEAVLKESQFSDNGTTAYSSYKGTTYQITKNDSWKDYTGKMLTAPKIYNASALEVLDTNVVNTSDGGYGFVLEYAYDKLPDDFTGLYSYLFTDGDKEKTPAGLRISGIIDKDGRITSETVTYKYTYTFKAEVERTDVNPNNSDTEGSTEPQLVDKTMTVEHSAAFTLRYDIAEVTVPDKIVIPAADDEKAEKPKELSIEDFLKLVDNDGAKEADKD